MATRNLLSRYRSISRPSLLGSSGGAYSSLAKKTQAAEDAIIDNQYESGDLSPEYYLNKLQERMGRGTLTPLQKVNLGEKIGKVQAAVIDADVDRRYAAGELTTEQVLGYEKSKLDAMTEPGSAAYIKQQQKVQGLQDKSEKEARTQFRVAENLRISRMPEDTSVALWEKAQLYQTLSDQARLDGDTQTADTLATQANNYVNSAKKADVNDLITGARLSTSATPRQGLGVPSSANGQNTFSQAGGGGSSTAVSGGSQTAPSAVTTTSGFQTTAVKNALESLDRKQMTIERLYGQLQDNQSMIAAYEQAISQASGDQKTSLTISLNNLIDAQKGIQNQIDNTTQDINDTVVRIQEAQAAAAFSSEKKDISQNEKAARIEEDNLNKEFREGKIDKQTYATRALQITEKKRGLYNYASEVYSAYGKDDGVDKYLDLINVSDEIANSQTGILSNIDDYEPIANDSNGKITDIFGNKAGAGSIALQDVSGLKSLNQFDANYYFKNGGYHKIQFPADKQDINGNLDASYVRQGLAKFNDEAFVNMFDPETGKRQKVKVGFIKDNFHGDGLEKPLEIGTIEKLEKVGAIKRDANGVRNLNPAKAKSFFEIYKTPKEIAGGFLEGIANFVKGGTKKPAFSPINVQDFLPNKNNQNVQRQSIPTTPGVGQKALDFVKKSVRGMNVFNPPTALASDEVPGGVSGDVGNIIDKVAEEMRPGDIEFKKIMHAIALAESGGNPNAVGDNGQSIGLYQNRMKFGRGGNYSKEQLLDPEFNTKLAAQELVKYYDQAISKGLTGRQATEYVSKYGQRPAPGNEKAAGSKYGQIVSGFKNFVQAPGRMKSAGESYDRVASKDYTDYSKLPSREEKMRRDNIALALGGKPGQYRPDLKDKQDQGAIDRAFRSDKATQDLLRSEGFKPSWETKSFIPEVQAAPIASVAAQTRQSIPQAISTGFNEFRSDVSNRASAIPVAIKNNIQNIGQKLQSSVFGKIQSAIQPKIISPLPQPPKPPTLVQKAGNVVQQAVSGVKNFFGNIFKRR